MFRFATRFALKKANMYKTFSMKAAGLFKIETKSVHRSIKQPKVSIAPCRTLSTMSAVEQPTSYDVRIQNVDEGSDDRALNIAWTDGSASRFPYLFLRENCKCPECFHPSSKQRQINTLVEVGPNIKPTKVKITEEGKHLKCLWQNGHVSVYSTNWLRRRRLLEPEERGSRIRNEESVVKDEILPWDRKRMQDKVLCFDYDTIMNNDRDLFDYLYALYQYGLVLLDNAPVTDGVLEMFSKRIGYLKPTIYGNIFDVIDKEGPSNLAYTSRKLYFHCDLPFHTPAPDIQCLHCIRQSIWGGKSLFVDAFNIAQQLEKTNPEAFKTLHKFIVSFALEGQDVFGEYSIGSDSPIIQLNRNGRIRAIMYNNSVTMDCFKDATPVELLKFYDAYFEFNRMLNLPENFVDMHLQPGQIVAFHNTRVMHSRTEFTSTGGSTGRWLQGIYFDWDAIFSKLHVIQKHLRLETPYLPETFNDFF